MDFVFSGGSSSSSSSSPRFSFVHDWFFDAWTSSSTGKGGALVVWWHHILLSATISAKRRINRRASKMAGGAALDHNHTTVLAPVLSWCICFVPPCRVLLCRLSAPSFSCGVRQFKWVFAYICRLAKKNKLWWNHYCSSICILEKLWGLGVNYFAQVCLPKFRVNKEQVSVKGKRVCLWMICKWSSEMRA